VVCKPQKTSFDLGSQDPVLYGQIFVPQKKFLVYGSGDVSKHANPNHSRASLNFVEPGLYVLLRLQKAVAQGSYEIGNQAVSMHLRFLTSGQSAPRSSLAGASSHHFTAQFSRRSAIYAQPSERARKRARRALRQEMKRHRWWKRDDCHRRALVFSQTRRDESSQTRLC
jgi:hypothetical protein